MARSVLYDVGTARVVQGEGAYWVEASPGGEVADLIAAYDYAHGYGLEAAEEDVEFLPDGATRVRFVPQEPARRFPEGAVPVAVVLGSVVALFAIMGVLSALRWASLLGGAA